MDICMLSELFYPFMVGGAERRYYEVAVRLAKRHEVTIYSLNMRGSPSREVHRGVEIVRAGAPHPLTRRSVPMLATYLPAMLKAASAQHDIIDANQGVSSFYGTLAPLTKRPVVATFHDVYRNDFGKYFPFPLSIIGKMMEFAWSRIPFDGIITVSPNTKRKMEALGFMPRISVVPSGVDKKMIDGVKARRATNVVFVGRLVPYKHVDALIRAFAAVQKKHPDTRLKIIGAGPEENSLKKLAARMGLNVDFLGFLDEREKIREIKSASLLVNPSTVEGLGLILLESMACGTPVIARNLDTYFFCSRENSIFYESEEQLANAMIEMMENRRLAGRLSRNGIKTAAGFSWDNVAERVEKIYEGLL